MSRNLNFKYVEDFVDEILDNAYADEDLVISIVAKYENMKEILKSIMLFEENIDFENICITDPDINGYTDEYVMDCFVDEDNIFINIEPVKGDKGCYNLEGDDTYIFEDCGSKVIDLCRHSNVYIVHVGEEDSFDCEDNKTDAHLPKKDDKDVAMEYIRGGDGDVHGFTVSRYNGEGYSSYSYITTDTVCKKEIDGLLDSVLKFDFSL